MTEERFFLTKASSKCTWLLSLIYFDTYKRFKCFNVSKFRLGTHHSVLNTDCFRHFLNGRNTRSSSGRHLFQFECCDSCVQHYFKLFAYKIRSLIVERWEVNKKKKKQISHAPFFACQISDTWHRIKTSSKHGKWYTNRKKKTNHLSSSIVRFI